MASPELRSLLLSCLSGTRRDHWAAHASELEAALAGAAERFALPLPLERFIPFLAERLPDEGPLSALHIADLFLACACIEETKGAATLLATVHHEPLLKALKSVCRDEASAAEATQRALVHALDSAGAALKAYSGRGPLEAWLRVVAVRFAGEALKAERARAEHEPRLAAEAKLAVSADGPVRQMDRQHLIRALESATRQLEPKDRALLRLNVVEGLNIDEIGVLYGVHRATVARWLAANKAQLFAAVRSNLRAELGLGEPELESLLHLADSELEVSLSRMLR